MNLESQSNNSDLSRTEQESVKDEAELLFEENKIEKLHLLFETVFNDFFDEHGYEKHESANLLSIDDKSVIFIGASISAMKDLLVSQDYHPNSNGVRINQECIRTHELKNAFNNDVIPFGQAYFNMSALLSKPGRFKDVVTDVLDFTQKKMGIDPDRIFIESTKAHSDLDDVDLYAGVDVKYDSKEPEKYIWQYGMTGVYGEGLSINIYNETTKSWWDVGNVVKILDEDGNELGTEFGYGHEFFLTAMLNVDDPSKLSKVFEHYEFKPGLDMKYHSYLELLIKMKEIGVKIGDHKASHIYKKYLKSLQYIGASLGIDENAVIEQMMEYSKLSGRNLGNFEDEKKIMIKHKKRKENFEYMIKNVEKYLSAKKHNQVPKENFTDPWKMIDKYILNNGINRSEVSDVLGRLDVFKK